MLKFAVSRWRALAIISVGLAIACGPMGGGYKVIIRQLLHLVAEPPMMPPPEGISVLRDVEFVTTSAGPLKLDLFTPDVRSAAPLPVVVFLFGGSWFAGNKNFVQLFDVPALLCRRGYAVISPEYRLSTTTMGWSRSPFPAQAHDAKAVLRWIKANAVQHNLDANAIGVWGTSAGAHLAALLGTASGIGELEGHPDAVGRANAVVHYFGPTHLPDLAVQNPVFAWVVEDLLGGTLEGERLRLGELGSPLHHVSNDSAPFLIVHGKEDPIVPLNQSECLHAKLQAAGVESTLVVIPGARHGTPEQLFTSSEEKERVGAFFDRHLKKDSKSPRSEAKRMAGTTPKRQLLPTKN